MKVWMNKRHGDYSGGVLLVAANSAREAHELCLNSDELEDVYWNRHFGAGETKVDVYNHYLWDAWQEVPKLNYNGDKPCVIAESGYSD